MNYRTMEVIEWDNLPHPDPRSRQSRITVRVAPTFWSRLRQHLHDARGSRGARSLWERWLTPDAVAALDGDAGLMRGEGPRRDPMRLGLVGPRHRSRHDSKPNGKTHNGDALPGVVVERLRETLTNSLESPLALCFSPGATSPSRPPHSAPRSPAHVRPSCLYYLVLTNGASLTLRGDATGLEVEDCFFSRAAVEWAEGSDDSEDSGATGGTEADCRQAVAGELVRRYGHVDDDGHFVLPHDDATDDATRNSNRHEIALPYQCASFIDAESWRFTGTGLWGTGNRNGHVAGRMADMPALFSARSRPAVAGGHPAASPAFALPTSSDFPVHAERNAMSRRPGGLAAVAERGAQLGTREAYRLVVAWGGHTAFGSGEGRDRTDRTDRTVTESAPLAGVALAAAAELDTRLVRWTADAEDMRERLQVLGGAAAEDLRLGLLESRTEAWAAWLALDASYAAALDAGDAEAENLSRLSAAMDSVITRLDDFDEALQQCEPCLAVSNDAPLLANWRKLLAEPFREAPPWWLERTSVLIGE